MTVGNVYNLKLFGNLQGVDNLNVFNYVVSSTSGGPDSASELATLFNNNVQAAIAAVAIDAQSYNRIEVFQWADPLNFDVIPVGGLAEDKGLRAIGDGMTNIVAWSFTLVRVAPGQRSGSKRIPGVAEDDLNGYVPTGAIELLLDALAVEMAATLAGGNAFYRPFVAKRPLLLGFTPTGYVPSTVTFAGVGSQVSRKRSLASQ
jgi:hypothetical protein